MKKALMIIVVLLISAAFVTTAIAKQEAKAPPEKAAAEKAPAPEKAVKAEEPAPTPLKTFFGRVIAVKPAKKSLVVEVEMAGEFTIVEKNVVINEAFVDEGAITFDVADATLKGCKGLKDIKKGDYVRVVYEKKGENFIAKEIRDLKRKKIKKKKK